MWARVSSGLPGSWYQNGIWYTRDSFGQHLNNKREEAGTSRKGEGERRRTGRKNLRLQCGARKVIVRMGLSNGNYLLEESHVPQEWACTGTHTVPSWRENMASVQMPWWTQRAGSWSHQSTLFSAAGGLRGMFSWLSHRFYSKSTWYVSFHLTFITNSWKRYILLLSPFHKA